MYRLIALALIALVAISSGLAHANGGPAVGEGSFVHHPAHHSEMSLMMDHGEHDRNSHKKHGPACLLGHCATACGVILPVHVTVVRAMLATDSLDYAGQNFVGLISSADPPPPKS